MRSDSLDCFLSQPNTIHIHLDILPTVVRNPKCQRRSHDGPHPQDDRTPQKQQMYPRCFNKSHEPLNPFVFPVLENNGILKDDVDDTKEAGTEHDGGGDPVQVVHLEMDDDRLRCWERYVTLGFETITLGINTTLSSGIGVRFCGSSG